MTTVMLYPQNLQSTNFFVVNALTIEALKCEQHAKGHCEPESLNLVYDWIAKLDRR